MRQYHILYHQQRKEDASEDKSGWKRQIKIEYNILSVPHSAFYSMSVGGFSQ